jgi:hypothetical protein
VRPFLHERLHRFERLLEASNTALRAYNDLDLGISDIVGSFLEGAAAEYHTVGTAEAENDMLALRAQLASAHRGIDPFTTERVTTRRREMERAVALRVLLRSSERLREDCDGVRQQLAATREQLVPIVLYALQKGFLPAEPDRAVPQDEIEAAWRSLLDDPESQAAARHLAMNASTFDIVLLLGDLLDAVR